MPSKCIRLRFTEKYSVFYAHFHIIANKQQDKFKQESWYTIGTYMYVQLGLHMPFMVLVILLFLLLYQ